MLNCPRSALAGVLLHLASSLLLLPNFPPLLWLVDGGALALLAAAPAPRRRSLSPRHLRTRQVKKRARSSERTRKDKKNEKDEVKKKKGKIIGKKSSTKVQARCKERRVKKRSRSREERVEVQGRSKEGMVEVRRRSREGRILEVRAEGGRVRGAGKGRRGLAVGRPVEARGVAGRRPRWRRVATMTRPARWR